MVLSRLAVFGDILHFQDDRFTAFDSGRKMKNVPIIHNVPGYF